MQNVADANNLYTHCTINTSDIGIMNEHYKIHFNSAMCIFNVYRCFIDISSKQHLLLKGGCQYTTKVA